jgi:hypothetical protein
MAENYLAIMIDPRAQHISELEWNGSLDELHALIDNAETLGHFKLAAFEDGHIDAGWIDDTGLSRGKPICAFLLPTGKDPIAGKCVIVGANHFGETASCRIPIAVLRQDVSWLGPILPEVTWDHIDTGSRAIVTYSRVKTGA